MAYKLPAITVTVRPDTDRATLAEVLSVLSCFSCVLAVNLPAAADCQRKAYHLTEAELKAILKTGVGA